MMTYLNFLITVIKGDFSLIKINPIKRTVLLKVHVKQLSLVIFRSLLHSINTKFYTYIINIVLSSSYLLTTETGEKRVGCVCVNVKYEHSMCLINI